MTQEAPGARAGDDLAADSTESAESADAAGEQDQVGALRQDLAEAHERMLRLAAELDNVRKRAARDVENARRYGLERLAQALLPVRDSLEAGLAAGESADAETLLEGKRATLRLLDSALEQVGISELDPEGEPFDPTKHEAMTTQPSATTEPNTVLTVVQKGYAIHDRLLRPARVVVSRAPEPKAAE